MEFKEEQPVAQREEASPSDMLLAAINKGIDAAGIDTLSKIHERWEARRAEQAFNAALAAFQAECPVVLKQTPIEFPTRGGGVFKSYYAPMEDIVAQTRELRARHGFSFSFDRLVTERDLTVWCRVHHSAGHSTKTPFSIPLPKEGKLSEAHAMAGAVTFAERYAFRGAFGITTGEDTDGRDLVSDYITPEQVMTLAHLIEETDSDSDAFWRFAKVDRNNLDKVPASDFARLQRALLDKKERREREEGE